ARSYFITHDFSAFLYHSLVSIYSGHAIQFSILVFIALLHLIEMLKRKEFIFRKPFHLFLILFLTIFLFLLSSKLVITFFFVYFAFVLIRSLNLVSKPFILSSAIGLIALFAFALIIPNPVGSRFREIIGTDFNFLKSEKYNPVAYFNGLQLRILQ